MGSFEDQLRDKFERHSASAPKSIWDNVEGQLNADLVFAYQSSQRRHKWLTVAAVFIAVLSLTFTYLPVTNKTLEVSAVEEGDFYNALLADSNGYSSFYPMPMTRKIPTRQLILVSVPTERRRDTTEEYILADYRKGMFPMQTAENEIEPIRVLVDEVSVDAKIHPYIQAFYPSSSGDRVQRNDQKLWAGIEAGAGNFNTVNQTSVANGSLNTLNLASAIGSNGFVNPSTVVDPTMGDGIATTVGVDFGVKLSRKWTLESGLAYTNVDASGSASISVLDIYTIDNSDFGIDDSQGVNLGSREAPLQVEDSYDHEVDLRNNIRFTSIPLKAGYFILDQKMSLRVNAGFTANYMVSNSLSDSGSGIINSVQSNFYNDWSFDGIGGLELGYAIFNNFDLTIEPNYRHAITPLSNSISSPSRFAIQTGLRYTLK